MSKNLVIETAALIMLGVTGTLYGAEGSLFWRDEPLPLLLREPRVQEELRLTKDQIASLKKLHERVQKEGLSPTKTRDELARLLKPRQAERLLEIRYQVRGGWALLDESAAKPLDLTEQQKKDLKSMAEDAEQRLRDYLSRVRFKNEEAKDAFVAKRRQEVSQRLLTVLTREQRQRFEKLQGKKLSFPLDEGGVSQLQSSLRGQFGWLKLIRLRAATGNPPIVYIAELQVSLALQLSAEAHALVRKSPR